MALLDFFKSDEQIVIERGVRSLDLFPGNLREYCELKGVEYVIMDTGRPEKFVNPGYYSNDVRLIEQLVSKGCVALIHYHPPDFTVASGFAVPVKLKIKK